MSKVSKVVLILSGIALVCIIGAGVVLGIFFADGSDLSSFFNLFGRNKIEVDESETLVLDDITAISIDCISGDIFVIPSDEAKVEMKGNLLVRKEQDHYLSVFEEGGVLTVKFDIDATFGNLLTSEIDIMVYLPQELMMDLRVFSTSGNFDMHDMELKNIKVINTSGNAAITGCSGADADINTTSGNTKISGGMFDSIDIVCQSGKINVEETQSDISVRNTSGTIYVNETYGELDIECTSGSVTVDMVKTEIVAIDIQVTSGTTTVNLDQDAAFDLAAKTTSGGVHCDFDILVSGKPSTTMAGDEIEGKVNGGGNLIDLATTSGSIRINAK